MTWSPGGEISGGADICSDFFKFQDHCACKPASSPQLGVFWLAEQMEALKQIQFDWVPVTSTPDTLLVTKEWQKMFPAHESILYVSWQTLSLVILFSFLSGTQVQFQWELAVCGCCAGLAGGGAFPAGSPVLTGVWRVKALQQDETLSSRDSEESVWKVSVLRNDEWKAFLLPGQLWDEKPDVTWCWPGLVKGRRHTWEDQDVLQWLITRCLMSSEPALPSVHVLHHSSVIHSS